MNPQSRRTFLASVGGGVALLAGCVESDSDAREEAAAGVTNDDASGGETSGDGTTGTNTAVGEIDVPLGEFEVPLGYELEALEADAVSGGVPKDGIPSIDDPNFGDVDDGDGMLASNDPVFGVEIDGDARAYPQHILVYHEIVNDEIGGRDVAVTYCPLTGTAIGFERGSVEFGVSGMLVNSNLIMYDRETDSWIPQILGAGILGRLEGLSLEAVRVTWTTWNRWKESYPETRVLTEETGFARNYSSDPYGAYNPESGYYSSRNTLFPPRFENDQFHPKAVFIGARSVDGAIAFRKGSLRDRQLLEGTVDGAPYLAAYHRTLDSAWVYRNPDDEAFSPEGSGYRGPGGEVYAADQLPLESVHAFDTFWFPWYGFYPETEVVD